MPKNVFGNSSSSYDNGKKIDTSLFVQKPYLRTNYIEANIEEDFDLRKRCTIKNSPDPISIREAASKSYVDNKFTDPSIMKSNKAHPDIDLNYKNIINVGLIELNRRPEYGDQVTSKSYVDNAIRNSVEEPTLLRLDPDEKSNLDGQKSKIPNSTLTTPKTIIEVPTKNYVDNKFNDPSVKKNNAHIDLNDRNITNARFILVNQWPQIDSHLTPKLYVDNAIDYLTLVRSNQDNDFNNTNLTNINSITLNKQAVNDNEVITKAYVDQYHREIERSRRNLGIDFYHESSDLVKNNQDKDFNDNKLTNIDSITVNRNPSSDKKVSNKKYIDDELDKNTLLSFIQTLQNYLRVT